MAQDGAPQTNRSPGPAPPGKGGATRPGFHMMDYSDRPDTVKVTVTTVFAPGMV